MNNHTIYTNDKFLFYVKIPFLTHIIFCHLLREILCENNTSVNSIYFSWKMIGNNIGIFFFYYLYRIVRANMLVNLHLKYLILSHLQCIHYKNPWARSASNEILAQFPGIVFAFVHICQIIPNLQFCDMKFILHFV